MTSAKTQSRVLKAIQEFRKAEGQSPTERELADHLKMPRATVHRSIMDLEASGTLSKKFGRRRGICLTNGENVIE